MHYVYLHGFTSGPQSYKGTCFRERFASLGIDLHMPDLNGVDFRSMTLTSQLHIAQSVLSSLPGDITLFGSSMGGYLATLLAQINPRVQQLVLMAPAFQVVSRLVESMGEEQHRTWREQGWTMVYHHHYQAERQLGYGIVEDARRYDQEPLERRLPALVFHGLHDDTVPYGLSVDYLRLNPAAELVLLASDHTLGDKVDTLWRYTRFHLALPEPH